MSETGLIPEGEYKSEVMSWDTVDSHFRLHRYVILRLQIIEGSYTGRMLICNIHDIRSLNKVLDSCNKDLIDGKDEEVTRKALRSLIGWKFIMTIRHRDWKDGSTLMEVKKIA